MFHGAGGLAAHHRFGARSGAAPLLLGHGLLAIALLPGGLGPALLAAIPAAGLGEMLFVAPGALVLNRRLLYRRSEEHTAALQSLMRISYAVFCLKNKHYLIYITTTHHTHPLLYILINAY